MASYAPFLFALLALLAQANAHNKGASVSIAACGKSLFKELCISTFASVPEAKTGDVFGLANIALSVATRQAIATQMQVQLLNKKTVDQTIKERIIDCMDNYQSATNGLKEAAAALKRKSFSDVNTLVSAAMSDAASCEDGIKEVRSTLTNLSPLNKKFNDLCSIVLTFSSLCEAPKVGLLG